MKQNGKPIREITKEQLIALDNAISGAINPILEKVLPFEVPHQIAEAHEARFRKAFSDLAEDLRQWECCPNCGSDETERVEEYRTHHDKTMRCGQCGMHWLWEKSDKG